MKNLAKVHIMRTTIFYFSATGNSLQLAKKVAGQLGTNNLVPIAKAMNKKTYLCKSKNIGLVFPVYAWGVPRIVIDFIDKLVFDGPGYLFSIVTCVGIPAFTLQNVNKVLQAKGARLNAGFVVKAKSASLIKKNILDHVIIAIDRKRKKMQTADERIGEMVAIIKEQQDHAPETSSLLANIIGHFFHRLSRDYLRTASTNFRVDDNCSGCGICASICPRNNISLAAGTPLFGNNCEFCHACIQWCPNFAIKHPSFDPKLVQYTHPDVDLQEFKLAKN
jgi:ferredoxin